MYATPHRTYAEYVEQNRWHALHGAVLFAAAQQERGRNVDIVVYGRDGTALTGMIRDTAAMQYRLLHFLTPVSYDAYLAALHSSVPEIICIAVPGAAGMEAAIAAHELCPKASLVWFAEDAAFGAQSYRVDCRYLTAEPVNEAVVAEAIRHCCSVSGYADTQGHQYVDNVCLVCKQAGFALIKPSGSGSSSDPYQLSCAEHLYWLADLVNSGNNSIPYVVLLYRSA